MALGRLRHYVKNNKQTVCMLDEKQLKDVGENDIPAFYELLSGMKFTSLYIDGLKVQDSVLSLLPALIKTLQLECFSFVCPNIGDETAEALAAALKNNTSLKRINLFGEKISDTGLKMLGEALKSHKVLEKFCVGGMTNVTDAALLNFSILVAQNTRFDSNFVNGFICLPFRSSQVIPSFVNQLFLKIIERNKKITEQKCIKDRISIYDKFAANWHESLQLPQNVTPDNFKLFPWRDRTKLSSLVDLCLFSVGDRIAKKDFETRILPSELQERGRYIGP